MPRRLLISRATIYARLLTVSLFVCLGGPSVTLVSAATPGRSGGLDFRSFLNSPPVMRELAFSSEKPPLAAGGTNRQPTQFYRVRWESPLKFTMQVTASFEEPVHTNNPRPASEWYCAGPTRWWHLASTDTNRFLVRYWDTATPSDRRRNPVLLTINTVRRVNLDHVLKLGLWHLPWTGVAWQGDRFAFTNETEQTTGSGQVFWDERGRARSVLYTFTRPVVSGGQPEMKSWTHRIEYAYDGANDLPQGFPSRIDDYVLRDNAPPFHNERINCERVAFCREPLSEAELDFEPIVSGRHATRWMVTNDTEHVFDGKHWKNVPDPAMFDRNHRTKVPRWTLFFVVAALLAPTILLALWARRKQSAAPNTEHIEPRRS